MASKSRAASKSSIKQIVVALRESAERIAASAQYTVKTAQEERIARLSKFAQGQLLALAGRADQVSSALTALSAKLEPAAPKATRPAKRKPAAKRAAPKAAGRRAAAAA